MPQREKNFLSKILSWIKNLFQKPNKEFNKGQEDMARYTTSGTKTTVAALNTELEKIATSQEDFVSRVGEAANQMESDFDMNSNKILNLPNPVDPTDVVRLKDLALSGGKSAITVNSVGLVGSVVADVNQTIFTSEEQAFYIVRDSNSYTAQVGDATLTNGNIAELQPAKDDSFCVTWFGAVSDTASQDTAFNNAAIRAKAYVSDFAGNNTRGRVHVPAGNWELDAAIATEAVWVLSPAAEMINPDNYASNNYDNMSYLTGRISKEAGRADNHVHFGSGDLGWIQDIRSTILGTNQMQVISPIGKGGILAASRTSDKSQASEGTIGMKTYIVNDNTTDVGVAYGMYKESIRFPNAGTTFAEESNVTTYGDFTPILPSGSYGNLAGITANYWVGGPVGSGPLDGVETKQRTSAGMVFTPGSATNSGNGNKLGFDAGIVFLQNCLEDSPKKEAIRFGEGHKIAWYPEDASNRTTEIVGTTENGNLTGVLRFRTIDSNGGGTLQTTTLNDTSFSADDGVLNLGATNRRWNIVWAVTGTINTSDEREKQQVTDIDAAELAVALELKQNIKKYKWNHAVEKKGNDKSRWHFGIMAQTVKSVFESNGLDPFDYGMLCYDEWEDQLDENGDVEQAAGNRYGVRYEELIMFILAAA